MSEMLITSGKTTTMKAMMGDTFCCPGYHGYLVIPMICLHIEELTHCVGKKLLLNIITRSIPLGTILYCVGEEGPNNQGRQG